MKHGMKTNTSAKYFLNSYWVQYREIEHNHVKEGVICFLKILDEKGGYKTSIVEYTFCPTCSGGYFLKEKIFFGV